MSPPFTKSFARVVSDRWRWHVVRNRATIDFYEWETRRRTPESELDESASRSASKQG